MEKALTISRRLDRLWDAQEDAEGDEFDAIMAEIDALEARLPLVPAKSTAAALAQLAMAGSQLCLMEASEINGDECDRRMVRNAMRLVYSAMVALAQNGTPTTAVCRSYINPTIAGDFFASRDQERLTA